MFCNSCGVSLRAGSRFCSSCGASMSAASEDSVPPRLSDVPPPDPVTEASADDQTAPRPLPPWATADWMQAAAAAVSVLAVVLIISSLVVLLGALLAGGLDEVPVFQSTFMVAAAAFGSDVGARGGSDFSSGSLMFSMIAIPLVLVPAVAARLASDRLADPAARDGVRLRAFAAKVALLSALGSIAVCAIASISFTVTDQFDDEYVGRFSATPTKAFFVTLVLVGCGALLTRLRHRRAPGPLRNLLAVPVGLAVRAYAISAAFVFAVSFVFTLIEGDLDGRGFLEGVYLIAVAGGTWALALVLFGMGIPVAISSSTFDELWVTESGHLLSSDVPGWASLALLVVPLAMAYVMWRHLEQSRPGDPREVSRVAALTAVCFAAIAVLGALVSRGSLDVFGSLPFEEDAFVFAEVSFNIGLAVVLGLVWGFVGVFLAAIPWSSKRGVPLIVTSASVRSAPPATSKPVESAAATPSSHDPGSPSSADGSMRLQANIPPPDPSKRSE